MLPPGVLVALLALLVLALAGAVPFQPGRIRPLENALHWHECHDSVFAPATTSDVVDIVKLMLRAKQAQPSRRLLLRTSHQQFFSLNNLTSCAAFVSPNDVHGSMQLATLTLDLTHMDKVLHVDKERSMVTVQSGITMEALEEALLDRDYSLPGWLVTPRFAGMTLAAMLDSGEQGSALVGSSALSTHVQAALLVDGWGKTQQLTAPGALLEGSLGLLGVVTELTIRVVPAKKVVVSERVSDDTKMVEEVKAFVDSDETMALEVTWSPTAGAYAARMWRKAAFGTPGETISGFAVQSPEWLARTEDMLALDQADQYRGTGSGVLTEGGYDLMCEVIGELTSVTSYLRAMEAGDEGTFNGQAGTEGGTRGAASSSSTSSTKSSSSSSVTVSNGDIPAVAAAQRRLQNAQGSTAAAGAAAPGSEASDAPFGARVVGGQDEAVPSVLVPTTEEVMVGWVNRLGSARCMDDEGRQHDDCLWRRTKVTPHTFSIASADLAYWVEDVTSIFSYTTSCPGLLIQMRFNTASPALLSPNHGRQSISINVLSVSSLKYNGQLLIKQQQVLDEVLQLSLCKYNARPHWALSTNRMLSSACGPRHSLGGNIDLFLKRLPQFDPQSLFLHPMFMRIAEGAAPQLHTGCAVTEDCFCEEDRHCGQGAFCVPGNAFSHYRVCSMTVRQAAKQDEL